MRIETGTTTGPLRSAWFEDTSNIGWTYTPGPATVVVLSPTELMHAYSLAGRPVPVERVSPLREIDINAGNMSTAKAINKAHEDSGLTWEQLARVFGVSRRAVHMWASGGRMNATNAELLMRFVDFVDQLPGSQDERRTVLLTVAGNGTSALDQFRSTHTNIDERFASLQRPESLMGALHGDVADK